MIFDMLAQRITMLRWPLRTCISVKTWIIVLVMYYKCTWHPTSTAWELLRHTWCLESRTFFILEVLLAWKHGVPSWVVILVLKMLR